MNELLQLIDINMKLERYEIHDDELLIYAKSELEKRYVRTVSISQVKYIHAR